MSKNNHLWSKKYLFYLSTKTLQEWVNSPIDDPCDYYSHCVYKKILEQRKRGKYKKKEVNKRPWRREHNYYKKQSKWISMHKAEVEKLRKQSEEQAQKRIEELQFLTEELEKVHNSEGENESNI